MGRELLARAGAAWGLVQVELVPVHALECANEGIPRITAVLGVGLPVLDGLLVLRYGLPGHCQDVLNRLALVHSVQGFLRDLHRHGSHRRSSPVAY